MYEFWRAALWSAAVIMAAALVWSWVDGGAASAQDVAGDDMPVSIEDEPYAYWKCWRTGTSVGYGFTAGPKSVGSDSTAAVPYMPDVDALREQGLLLSADGTGDGRLHYDRSGLLSARFYRNPGLRDGLYKPLPPGNPNVFKPLVDPDDATKASGYFLESTDALPRWNPWVMEADGRISKLEITWDTHAGVSGEGAIDEVLRAQQEQSADAETSEHLVYRQGAYRGAETASGGVLDPFAQVHEVGSLGSASPSVGYRVETGYQEDQVVVISGNSYTRTSGSNTTTTYNLSSSPRNVVNEISVTNRNSAQHPEVNTAQLSVQEAVPELMLVGYTVYQDDSVAAPPKPGDALLDNGAVRILPGRQVVMTTDTPPRPACYVAGSVEKHRGSGSSRHYQAYCWMVRAGAEPVTNGATQSLSVPSPIADGMEYPITDTSGLSGTAYAYVANVTASYTAPVYGIAPQPGENDGVLDANTPGERRDGLAPEQAADGPNDALIVAIDLKTDHRRDPETDYNAFDGSGDTDYRWKLFGDETVRPKTHLFASGVLGQVGYEQSYLVPSFFDGGDADKKKKEVILPYLYDHEGGVEKFGLDSVFLWPVRLDEMNYYLFRVPDFTHGHQMDRGHIMNMAYAHSSGVTNSNVSVGIAGLTINLVDQPRGQAVAVPDEVEGTSGRTDFGFTAHHINPFTDGKIYYPFFDHDSYNAAVTGGYDTAAGAGAYGYASGAKGLVLSGDMLVKAGVAAPLDRGHGSDAYGNNATFRFQIDEGVPAPAAEGGSREDLLKRLGFAPSYLASENLSDANNFERDPLVSAWPNERIDPDDAHVLVVTFYEGRLGGEWRIQRVIDVPFTDGVGLPEQIEAVRDLGQDAVEGAAGFLYGLVGGDSDDVDNLVPDLGSVPRFQYRRVMCRILVPADGVVVPASGWEGVKDKLGDVMHGIVGALTGILDKLIAWLESVPLRMIETTARMSAEATCMGAKMMDDMGELSSADQQSGVGVAGADVSISGPEANSRMGERACEEVSEEASTLEPDCSDTARAVGDPACSSVPGVGFRTWRATSTDLGNVRYLSTGGRDGVDQQYAARWVPRHGDEYQAVEFLSSAYGDRLGVDFNAIGFANAAIGLKESVDIDLGVGAARLHFDYDNVDLLYDRNVDTWSDIGILHAPTDDARWEDKEHTAFMADRLGARYDGYILHVRPDPKAAGFYAGDKAALRTLLKDKMLDVPGAEFEKKLKAGDGVSLGLTEGEQRFVLPLYYLQYGLRDFSTNVTVRRVRGFDIGTVLAHKTSADCQDSHVPILASTQAGANTIGEPLGTGFYRLNTTGKSDHPNRFVCRNKADEEHLWALGNTNEVVFVGRSDWPYLDGYLKTLWYLGDAFSYQFALSAYRGMPGVDDAWVEGPRSPWVTVSGGADLACRDPYVQAAGYDRVIEGYFGISGYSERDWDGDGNNESAGEYYRMVYDRYVCKQALGPGGAVQHLGPGTDYYRAFQDAYNAWVLKESGINNRLEPDAGRGVLGAQMAPDLSGIYGSTNLLGSQVCGNFWNGTPPSYTWDSPITRGVWHISWVLALLVLFVLLLWDGLSLTYNGMLSDGRGSVTLRTILPRFALALLLAAASLLICRVVLTLASDVTCYVSHATGMTFWGFLGGIVLPAIWGFLNIFVTSVLTPYSFSFAVAGPIAVVFLAFLLIMLWYLGKVLIGMVMRILLLMILAGLSPVAMAMYASPSTEHWTKKWVSLFLGAAFQQVVVLMVLFCGAGIGMTLLDWNWNWSAAGVWTNIGMIFLDILLVLFTLFFAARVPDLINPGGKGLFSGLGQALMIAGAAAAVIATAGAGAIGGALAGMGGAAGGAGGGGGFLGGMGSRIGSMFGGGGTNAASNMMGAAGQPGQQAVTNSMANMQANASGIGSQPSLPGMGGGQGEAGTAAGAGGEGAAGSGTPPVSGDGAAGSVRPQGRSDTAAGGGPDDSGSGVAGDSGAPASGSAVSSAPEAPGDVSDTGSGDRAQPAAASGAEPAAPGMWKRMARGAHYGAAQGQRYARMIQTYGRGNFGAPPDRGRSRAARVDVQGFRNFVNNVPPESDPAMQAEVEQRRREGGMGPTFIGRRGGPDNDGENETFYGNEGSSHQDNG